MTTSAPTRVGAGDLGRKLVRPPPRSSRPRAHGEQVLVLEARLVAAPIPFLTEPIERLVELRLAAAPLGVGPGRDGRAVASLEMLAVVARPLESRDVEHFALQRPPLHAIAEHLAHVLLAAPQQRRLRPGRRRGGERS